MRGVKTLTAMYLVARHRRLSRVNSLMTKVFGTAFAVGFSSQALAQKSVPFACVRPAYPPELAIRMPVSRMVGIEEGLAIIAQVSDGAHHR